MQHVLNVYFLPHIIKLKRSVFSLGFNFLRFIGQTPIVQGRVHGLLAVAGGHVQIRVDNPVRFVIRIRVLQSKHRLRILQLKNTTLHVFLKMYVLPRLAEHQRALRLVLVLLLMPARIIPRVSVPHQILLVDVFYRLKVAFGRLKFEAVALLERDLEMLFLFGFRGERFALSQLLFLEKSSRYQLRVFRMGNCC